MSRCALAIAALLMSNAVRAEEPVVRAEEAVQTDATPDNGVRVSGTSFALELHLATWFRVDLVENVSGVTTPFSVPLVRPWIRATLLDERISVLVQPELAGSPRLLDLHLDVRIVDALSVRVGQFRTPFSRAYINPIITLALPDRGLVSDTFRLGRDTGILLFGSAIGGAVEYSAGVMNGARINDLAGDVRAPLVVGRLVANLGQAVPYDQVPFAERDVGTGVALGAATAYQRRKPLPSGETEESWRVNAEASFMTGRFIALGEAFVRRSRAQAGWTYDHGGYAQASLMLVPRAWDVAVRFGRMRQAQSSTTVELGTNLYWWPANLGHHAKLQLRYQWSNLPLWTEHVGRAQIQLSF